MGMIQAARPRGSFSIQHARKANAKSQTRKATKYATKGNPAPEISEMIRRRSDNRNSGDKQDLEKHHARKAEEAKSAKARIQNERPCASRDIASFRMPSGIFA